MDGGCGTPFHYNHMAHVVHGQVGFHISLDGLLYRILLWCVKLLNNPGRCLGKILGVMVGSFVNLSSLFQVQVVQHCLLDFL